MKDITVKCWLGVIQTALGLVVVLALVFFVLIQTEIISEEDKNVAEKRTENPYAATIQAEIDRVDAEIAKTHEKYVKKKAWLKKKYGVDWSYYWHAGDRAYEISKGGG